MQENNKRHIPNLQGTTNSARTTALNDLVSQVHSEKTKNYIANRLMPQMEWYSCKSRKCKKQYYFWTTVTILLSALIPVVSIFADRGDGMKALLVVLGSNVTACNTYLALHNFKDLWLTYRKLREKLLRVLYCYFNNVGVFSQNIAQDAKDVLLVDICEEKMSSENKEWVAFVEK